MLGRPIETNVFDMLPPVVFGCCTYNFSFDIQTNPIHKNHLKSLLPILFSRLPDDSLF